METIVRTIAGAQLQTCQLLGLPFPTGTYRTLNERFKVAEDIAVSPTEPQTLKYFMIGCGGHRMVSGADGLSAPEPVQHSPRDTCLYKPLPFVMRTLDNDLDTATRLNYRLRTEETHNGIRYVCYYAKVMDLSATVPSLELRKVSDGGSVSSSPFSFTASDLSPSPPPITSGSVLVTTGDYIAATAKVPFSLTPDEISDFLEVATIIYGSDNYAMISEIGLCSGVDKVISANINGATVALTEALNMQVVSFVDAFYAAKFTNNGIDVMFDTGSVEPLLALSRA